jgi:hypothetical protein
MRHNLMYQLVFSDGDLHIHVEDQVTEGDHVASRWVAEGHNRGRAIRIWGIVTSRVEAGEIIEDWAASEQRRADSPARFMAHAAALHRLASTRG